VRTKQQLSRILSRRDTSREILSSNFSDLMTALQAFTGREKRQLMTAVKNNHEKRVGNILHRALLGSASSRSTAKIDAMLMDDNLTVTDLDEIL